MPRGNRTGLRGHRPRKAIVAYEGAPALRLAPPAPAELRQLRAWARTANDAALHAAHRAVLSMLAVVEDEQAARFEAADADEDAAEQRRILEALGVAGSGG